MTVKMLPLGNSNITSNNDTLPEKLEEDTTGQPNTALLSFLLCFGTFGLATVLKNFKTGQYFGKTVRYGTIFNVV